jgi:hypothetical protein
VSLLFNRDYRSLALSVLYVAASGLILSALFFFLYGASFTGNIIDGVKNGININSFVDLLRTNFLINGIVIVFSFYVVPFFLFSENKLKKTLAIAVLFSFAFATAGILKNGAALNYYDNYLFLSLIAIAVYFRDVQAPVILKESAISLLFVYALFMVVLFFAGSAKYLGSKNFFAYHARQMKDKDQLAAYIRGKQELSKGGYILCFGTSLMIDHLDNYLCEHALFPHKEISKYQDDLHLFNYGKLKEIVGAGKLKFILVHDGQTMPVSYMGASLDGYHLSEVRYNYKIYSKKE